MPRSAPAPLPEGLPLRLRIQFRMTRRLTALLRILGLRESVIRGRGSLLRVRRRLFERRGSVRYSTPALHQIDRKLDRIIDQDRGVFVEAGGHDGFTQSNTYYLERFRGWSGVLVEPIPELAAEARRNRPGARVFECALVPFERAGQNVEVNFGDLFSGVARDSDDQGAWAQHGLVLGWRDPRRQLVPGRPLSELLNEARP